MNGTPNPAARIPYLSNPSKPKIIAHGSFYEVEVAWHCREDEDSNFNSLLGVRTSVFHTQRKGGHA